MRNSSISTIFEKGEDSKYTRNALLYQHILKYAILVGEQSSNTDIHEKIDTQVSLWDMIVWLKKTFPEFKSKYSDKNISKTVNIQRRRIKGKLDDLVNLELLQSEKKKQDKGDGTTDKYRFTKFGRLLGWIINSIDFDNSSINRRETINKQIFNLLEGF